MTISLRRHPARELGMALPTQVVLAQSELILMVKGSSVMISAHIYVSRKHRTIEKLGYPRWNPLLCKCGFFQKHYLE
jgi:hypothetical protein